MKETIKSFVVEGMLKPLPGVMLRSAAIYEGTLIVTVLALGLISWIVGLIKKE